MSTLEELLEQWKSLAGDLVWLPDYRNRPQIQAYFTPAFETLYGGAAGGGKSDLILGLARTMHKRSLLLRREFPDLERSLISRSLEFYGDKNFYNSSRHVWELEGRRIEFGHMEHVGTPQIPGDEAQYAGAPYDMIGFDQLEQFPQYAYEFMFSRARSAKSSALATETHRARVISTANFVGMGVDWIANRWKAWLIDEVAKPGEIRWYKRDAENHEIETEADDPDALSRTYIPAGLKDNPYLGDEYRRVLMTLPEPLRSALLNGDWKAGLEDDAYQVIPRGWVRAAFKRWEQMPRPDLPKVVGLDVARGGDDKTVIAERYGNWFDELQKHPGRSTPDGQSVVSLLSISLTNGGSANIDVIGVGASAYDLARQRRLHVQAVNFAESSNARDKGGSLRFVNKRAECYWRFREALDPNSGAEIALPYDPELEADLCAPRWQSQANGIKIESKDDIRKRIGRSPDCADAVVLSWYNRFVPSDEEIIRYQNNKVDMEALPPDLVGYINYKGD